VLRIDENLRPAAGDEAAKKPESGAKQ